MVIKRTTYVALLVPEEELLEDVSLQHPKTDHMFEGISMGASYEVNIDCLFGNRSFFCGRQAILSCRQLTYRKVRQVRGHALF